MKVLEMIKKKPLELGTLIVSIVAIVMSFISLRNAPKRHSDNLTSETIREVYSEFIELTNIQSQFPYQSHLFCLPQDYLTITKQVVEGNNTEEDFKNLLIERAIANRIFTQYEQAYYLWQQAQDNNDSRRAGFLKEVLNYYTGRLLRNPRLLWYWNKDGGNLEALYEKETVDYYKKFVLPEKHSLDSIGPFRKGVFK